MSNKVFHFSNSGISSGQRFYLKDDVSGIFLRNLNIDSNFPVVASNLVYNTGNQNISGTKTFNVAPVISGNPFITGVDLSSYATTSNLASTGLNLSNNINSLSGLFTGFTGNLDATFASDTQLASTGTTLTNTINSLSGTLTSTYATITNLASTGSSLDGNINSLSGTLTSTYATITNLANTGSTLDIKINNLSGYITGTNSTFTTNLASTGSTLNTNINNLSGYINSSSSNIVFTTGDQTISGNKTFNNTLSVKTISGLSGVGGNTASIDIKAMDNALLAFGSNYVGGTINITAGSGNIQGGGLGLYAGKFGNIQYGGNIDAIASNININQENTAERNITIYKTGAFATANVAIGQNLVNVTNTFAISGVNVTPALYATSANLASTGSTLNSSINSLSGLFTGFTGSLDTTFASDIQLANTGSTLVGSISSLSGTLTSTYATITNLASTGSTLDTKINNLSGISVLTFGDQNISGNKTFINNINVSGSGIFNALDLNNIDLLSLSGVDISIISGNIALTNRPTVNGTGVVLSGELDSTGILLINRINSLSGSLNSSGTNLNNSIISLSGLFTGFTGNLDATFASDIQLFNTGVTLNTKIDNLSGVSVLTFGNQIISGVKTFSNGSNQILNTTYSSLTGLKAISGLLSGQLYRISDFVLKWNNQSINDQTVKTAASGEPLIVTALSKDKIYHLAQSEIYPQDTIYYNIDATSSYSWGNINNNSAIPDFKGWIYRRVDNLLDIDIPYDWRNITVNCCKPDVSSVPYYSGNYSYNKLDCVIETGNNINRGRIYYSAVANNIGVPLDNNYYWAKVSNFVESGTYFSTDESYGFRGVYDGAILGDFTINLPALTGSRIQQPAFTSTLTGLGTFALYNIKNVKIEGGYNNVIVGNGFEGNTIVNGFINNTIDANFSDNTIGSNFNSNTIGSNFNANTIGSNFNNNNIYYYFASNNIGHSFSYNSTSFYYSYNNIGHSFNGNLIKDFFAINTIGSSFSNNTISNDCSSNTIGSNFNANTIGPSFRYNTIGNSFYNNNIGDGFNYNTSEDDFNSIDFTSSTHVYNSYNTTLFQNSANSMRLRYFNSSDQLVVTDPTA
jgi:hypothetical protein